MTLFDKLCIEAIQNTPELSSLRLVVEKELLHHDILSILSSHNLLKDLTFIGGTCLRMCYGGVRLSEDLDFTGGQTFTKESLSSMGQILCDKLAEKYGLHVSVTEPQKETDNVDTWKIKIETRPEQKNLPAQRINIDICAIPSYEKRPMMLLNFYEVNMGTSGLILQAQSQEEIYTDKLIAFALRPNRIKHRDLWDIIWLHQKNIKPNLNILSEKLRDRSIDKKSFLKSYQNRLTQLETEPSIESDFRKEMSRFLPADIMKKTLSQQGFWDFLKWLIHDHKNQIEQILKN